MMDKGTEVIVISSEDTGSRLLFSPVIFTDIDKGNEYFKALKSKTKCSCLGYLNPKELRIDFTHEGPSETWKSEEASD